MSGKRVLMIAALFICILYCVALPIRAAAQDLSDSTEAQQDQPAQDPAPGTLWSFLKEGKISFNARFRFEGFERDGAPFTGTSYAPTLRLALGYATPAYHGFSLFAQGEGVIVTGAADYSVPALPSMSVPDRPAILDPRSIEANQGYVKWAHEFSGKNLAITVGRQELALNDGRFLSISTWRQVHGTFDAAKIETDLPLNLSFTYAFINRLYRVDGYNASDGDQPMHSHMWNLVWRKPDVARVALYGLLLDYHRSSQFTNSTQTYGLRATGPYKLSQDWSVIYTAEYAKQKNYGLNPNHVDANYYLGELGPGWRGFGLKAGYAFLAGHSPTDLLTTPAAPPFNGWTDLFINNPILGPASGLEARYLNASGPIKYLDGTTATVIFYDYHSDNLHVHYGQEFDAAMAYKVKRITNRWEIGWRFGRYWADHLFTNSVRTSLYTSFTL
jgi:alginate export protein